MILTGNKFFKINQTHYQIVQLKAVECQSFLPFSINDVHLCEVFLQVECHWEMLSIAYFFCSMFFDNKFISLFLSLLNVALNVRGGYYWIISFPSILRRGSTGASMVLRPAVPIFQENESI